MCSIIRPNYHELLHAQLRDFEPEQAGADAEYFTRVSFFDLLESHEREAILTRRLAYLQACLEYLQKLQHLADTQDCSPETVSSMSPAQRVLAFHLRRVHDEYQWIATWLEEIRAPR